MLEAPLRSLFRLQNVSTKRRDKINSDEEERMRMGYEIITGVRFVDQGERPAYQTAMLEKDGVAVSALDLRPRGDVVAHQSGLEPPGQQRAAWLCAGR